MSSRAGGSPFLVHHNPKPQSPRRTAGQVVGQHSPQSAPSSPTQRTYRMVAGYGYPSQPHSARVDKIYADDATWSDSMRDHDDGDPHDLSFPSKHFPRASMVDNLVMSLDQFSPATDTSRQGPRSGYDHHIGHVTSSSITVGTESKTPLLRETPAVEVHPAKDGPALQQVDQIPSVFGEEEESQREKAYNAQRAMQSGKVTSNRANTKAKTRSDSNSSSIDLSHLSAYAGRLGNAGNRRSQSFDFGSSRPKQFLDANEAATPAAAHQTTDAQTTAASAGVVNQLARRNSGKSMRGNHSRRGRSGTIGTNNIRSRIESPQPQLTTKSQTFDVLEGKAVPSVQSDQAQSIRAGFFRRVFGSSNKSNANTPRQPSPSGQSLDHTKAMMDLHRPNTPPVKAQRNVLVDPSHNKENQPVISKKPSSFFRRRKKSASGGVPPPLPLTLNANLETTSTEAGGSSPVSSLRAFMDPYLGDTAPRHARGSSLQSVQNVDDPIPMHNGTDLNNRSNTEKLETQHQNTPLPKQDNNSKDVANKPLSKNTVLKSNDITGHAAGMPIPSIQKSPVRPTTLSSSSSSPAKLETGSLQRLNASTPTPERPRIKQVATNSSGDTSKEENGSVPYKQPPVQASQDTLSTRRMIKLVPQSSGSDTSDYRSAPSTPMVAEKPELHRSKSPIVHVSHPSISQNPTASNIEQARKIYNNTDEQVNSSNAVAWLGEASTEREQLRTIYMGLFDWTNFTILAALRNLCSKLVLKGETQQVDRILDAFAMRWCECNPNHGFKTTDIVHTICYSILLLNTDLHLADIGKKMTRNEFVRNAMDTIKENMSNVDMKQVDSKPLLGVRTNSYTSSGASLRPSMDRSVSSLSTTRPIDYPPRDEVYDESNATLSGPLVEAPFNGSQHGWDSQVENVLREFYSSISREPLPLSGMHPTSRSTPHQSMNNLSSLSALRRTPSTLSKATSESRGRYGSESRSLGTRWSSKTRSRPRLTTTQGFASSRTSIDDQSSAWSPSISSTWSRVSLNKTLTSMSVESFATDHIGGGYQSSIGFANALSQAIIRDEQIDSQADEGFKAGSLLEDESLELYGAPWAKEGILKHKCHLEGVDKRSKDRNWNDCFAVIEKGWMRLFSFSMTAKSLRNKARNHKAGAVVGGGNWQDNAEEVWKFMLRHTIASSLPPPGYSKQRPYVWALSLPNGAVHLFSVGTPDIVKEFVSTANFWSARLSKEPMTGGVSSMEYGWSDGVINRALIGSDSQPGFHAGSPRPSTQLSMRSSIDHGHIRSRLPGDKAHISEWVPPQQSLMPSQLMEIDQLKALQAYVQNIEDELQRHNELRGPMLLAFSTRHPNSQKAMTNWEKKSSYLLREIVKFQTYIDALESAQTTKDKVDKLKQEQLNQRTETNTRRVSVEDN